MGSREAGRVNGGEAGEPFSSLPRRLPARSGRGGVVATTLGEEFVRSALPPMDLGISCGDRSTPVRLLALDGLDGLCGKLEADKGRCLCDGVCTGVSSAECRRMPAEMGAGAVQESEGCEAVAWLPELQTGGSWRKNPAKGLCLGLMCEATSVRPHPRKDGDFDCVGDASGEIFMGLRWLGLMRSDTREKPTSRRGEGDADGEDPGEGEGPGAGDLKPLRRSPP